MIIQSFTFNPFQTNCYVCADGRSAVVIDPASADETEHRRVLDYIADEGLVVEQVLLTHAHVDHIFGLARVCQELEVPFSMHREDVPLLEHAEEQARLFGVDIDSPPSPGSSLGESDEVTVGETTLRVLHTPGHSPGSISFFNAKEKVVLCGDVLFSGSIGRTDLWKGSLPVLMQSVFQKLVPLGSDVRVLSGHGPETTIERELATNPFLTDRNYRPA